MIDEFDIELARKEVRSVVDPLKLVCHSYFVNSQIGIAIGDGFNDSLYRVNVNTVIYQSNEFPSVQYDYLRSYVCGSGHSCKEAHINLMADLMSHVDEWRSKLDEDKWLSNFVGKIVVAIKDDKYYVSDSPEGEIVPAIPISVGDKCRVVSHKPGILCLRTDHGHLISVYTRNFRENSKQFELCD